MTQQEREIAQMKYDKIAEGYKETIDILKQGIDKIKLKLGDSTLTQPEINDLNNRISQYRQIIRENKEIYNTLTNYYIKKPCEKKRRTKSRRRGLLNYSNAEVIRAYNNGNFNICANSLLARAEAA